jgi:hypothetical protein
MMMMMIMALMTPLDRVVTSRVMAIGVCGVSWCTVGAGRVRVFGGHAGTPQGRRAGAKVVGWKSSFELVSQRANLFDCVCVMLFRETSKCVRGEGGRERGRGCKGGMHGRLSPVATRTGRPSVGGLCLTCFACLVVVYVCVCACVRLPLQQENVISNALRGAGPLHLSGMGEEGVVNKVGKPCTHHPACVHA